MLKTLFKKLWNKNFIILTIFIASFFIFNIDVVTADAPSQTEKEIAALVTTALHFMIWISWFIVWLMWKLLSNDLIMSPMTVPTLHAFWGMMRNLVNLMYVWALLFVAFKILFNVWDDALGKLKELLPKIIFWLVLVNFSFLAMTFLIDVSGVATMAGFSLSSVINMDEISKECKENNWGKECIIPVFHAFQYNHISTNKPVKNCWDILVKKNWDICFKPDSWDKQAVEMKYPMFVIPWEENTEIKDVDTLISNNEKDLFERNFVSEKIYSDGKIKKDAKNNPCKDIDGKDNAICDAAAYLKLRMNRSVIIWVVNNKPLWKMLSNIDNNNVVPLIASTMLPIQELAVRSNTSEKLWTLIAEIIFKFLFSLIMIITFSVLWLLLIVRVSVLWLWFIFCPFLIFAYLSPFEHDVLTKVKDQKDTIIKMAFIPAIFGIVMSIWIMMISVLNVGMFTWVAGDNSINLSTSILESWSPLLNMLMMATIIVMIWVWLFAAMSDTGIDVVNSAVKWVKWFGQGAARLAIRQPLNAPLVPMAWWKSSMADVFRSMGTIKNTSLLGKDDEEKWYKLETASLKNDINKIKAKTSISNTITLNENNEIKTIWHAKKTAEEILNHTGIKAKNITNINDLALIMGWVHGQNYKQSSKTNIHLETVLSAIKDIAKTNK